LTPRAALQFIERHGVVLESGRGRVPSLAEAIAGEPIRGSWWGHAERKRIFHVLGEVSEHPDVLRCRLAGGKVTYVHKRLWPAVVKLAADFDAERLARTHQEHTASGAHRTITTPFPEWVPRDVLTAAKRLSEADARTALAPLLAPERQKSGR
jgi:hypothetical protein